MTIEVMVFALWVAALFLVLWQIIISIQFSRMSSNFKTPQPDFEEGWNYGDMERLFKTMASEIIHEEHTPQMIEDSYHEGFGIASAPSSFTGQEMVYDDCLSVDQYLSSNQGETSEHIYAGSEQNYAVPEQNHYVPEHISVDREHYLNYLESRIDSLENLMALSTMEDSESGESANMSAGHLGHRMTQYEHIDDSYEHEFTDEHYIQPLKVAVNDSATPVRLRRVR